MTRSCQYAWKLLSASTESVYLTLHATGHLDRGCARVWMWTHRGAPRATQVRYGFTQKNLVPTPITRFLNKLTISPKRKSLSLPSTHNPVCSLSLMPER